ncbi:50S ribosomal protein L9 [soil metagenome]
MARVILRSDLEGLGKRGDIINVSDGHARNYLLPKGLAMKATEGAAEQASKMRQARDVRDHAEREQAQSVASSLVAHVITVSAKAGPEGKLFGSVTTADIVAAVQSATGIVLDRRDIETDPIRTVGEHQVRASLHSDVSFPITLDVVPE